MIIEKLKKGDMKAFEELYESLHKRLFNFIYRIINNQEISEDIVQSTFFKVWENRKKLSSEKPLDAQVYIISKNLLFNYIKRQNIEKQIIEKLSHSEQKFGDSRQQVIYNETMQLYQNVIDLLPPKRRNIYKLSKIEGFSNTEIAKLLSISNNTVENHLSKANHFVRGNLKFLKESIAIFLLIWFF